MSASTEMGQGEATVMRTILARALQVDRERIGLAEVNTDLVPDSGPTVASRTTMVVGSLLVEAAEDLIGLLKKELGERFHHKFEYKDGFFKAKGRRIPFSEAVQHRPGAEIHKEYHHPPFIKFDDIHWRGDAYPVFSWAAAVAEIEVDPVTFEITVTRYTTTHDIGKAINHDQAVAQIQGGSLQGIGYALYEKITLENGHYDISGFTDYIIPTAEETPVFNIRIMENPYPYGPFGAKGLGEMPLVGAAPAVVSALWMIFGHEFTRIPVTPEELAALFYTKSEGGS
jgi:CO/xanthine dehydrogenase Mo-binding subunit